MVFSKSCNFRSRLGWTCRISIDLHCLGWGGRSRVFLLRRLHRGRRRGGRRRPRPAEQQALFEFEHFAGLEFLAGAHKKRRFSSTLHVAAAAAAAETRLLCRRSQPRAPERRAQSQLCQLFSIRESRASGQWGPLIKVISRFL